VTFNALDQAVANQLGVAGTKCVINGYTRAQRSEFVKPIVERDYQGTDLDRET
jgi:hypothetical protein